MARIQRILETVTCPSGLGAATLTGRFLITSTEHQPDAACTLLDERCDRRDSLGKDDQRCDGACGLGQPSSPLRKHEYLKL